MMSIMFSIYFLHIKKTVSQTTPRPILCAWFTAHCSVYGPPLHGFPVSDKPSMRPANEWLPAQTLFFFLLRSGYIIKWFPHANVWNRICLFMTISDFFSSSFLFVDLRSYFQERIFSGVDHEVWIEESDNYTTVR